VPQAERINNINIKAALEKSRLNFDLFIIPFDLHEACQRFALAAAGEKTA